MLLPISIAEQLADQRTIVFEQLGTRDGLSQGGVLDIEQDHIGLIWIGTAEGLNVYDGSKFESFYHSESPGSLSHDNVWSLLSDSSDRLWIGTENGLNLYDRLTNSFEIVDLGFPESDDSVVYSLLEDSSGNIWVGSDHGLTRISKDGVKQTFVNDLASEKSLARGSVRAIFESKDQRIWVGTQLGGVSLFDSGSNSFTTFSYDEENSNSLSGNYVRSIEEDEDGRIWVATFSKGVSIFDRRTYRWERLSADPSDPHSLGSNRVRSVFKDMSGGIWVATDDGLCFWNEDIRGFQKFVVEPTDPRSLIHNTVITITQDRGGVIWVGTFDGISRWNAKVEPFASFQVRSSDGTGFSESSSSFAEMPNGDLWIGTFSGLNKWDSSAGLLKGYSAANLGLHDKTIMSLHAVGSELWAGSMSGGIYVIENERVVRNFVHDPSDPSSLSSNAISSFLTASSGDLWVTTYGGGVNRHVSGDRFERFPRSNNQSGSFLDLRCMDIIETSDGIFWIATDGGGITILDSATGDTKSLSHEENNANSIPSNNIVTLLKTDKAIWVGSRDQGLGRYDLDSKTIKTLTKADGLASDAVYGLLEDDNGNIWISGGKGLSVYDDESGSFTLYDSTHGLQSDDFNSGAYLKTKSGVMLFGGNNGFNAFNPGKVRKNLHVPDVILRRFSKFNKSFALPKPIHAIEQIELDYRDSVIGFEFAVLDYTAPEKNQYRYKLEGFDPDWIDAADARQATYTNLDAGNYVFRVIGSNNDGVWNEEGASVALQVHPPPWATWWAYSAYGLLVVFLLWQMLQVNTQRQQRTAEKRYSERLQLYIESLEEATDCVLIADHSGALIYANNATEAILGKAPRASLGKPMLSVLFDDSGEAEDVSLVLEKEGRFHGEISATGELQGHTTEVTIAQVSESGEEGSAYVAISRDVTQRKRTEAELENHRRNLEFLVNERTRALEKEIFENKANQKFLAESLQEKELLLKEVHHRVKNNMQVISSLLNLQAETANNQVFTNLLGESQQRIKSMSLIHENLYQNDNFLEINFEDYINMLASSLARFYAIPDVQVRLDVAVEDVVLDLDKAVPCGLIINELVSNALKHAFKGRSGVGTIHITFTKENCGYVLRIRDDGNGLPEGFSLGNTTSMGMEIVSILTEQLDGKIMVGQGPGASFEITIPGKVEHEQS